MKLTKRMLSFIMALALIVCAVCIPAQAAAAKAVTPVGKAYEYIMENG